MSLRLKQLVHAKKLFEEMSNVISLVQPDICTYNIMLKDCFYEIKQTCKNQIYISSQFFRLFKNLKVK